MLNGLRNRAARFLQRPGTADLRPYLALLPTIADREQAIAALGDGELAAAARQAADAADDAMLCAFGREAARRALGERPFDVQLVGTLAMMNGQVAEMATGEGKTLSGALAAAGYALRGRSVNVMSVNDYLARRDAEWMRPVYDLLGVTVGWIGQASTPADRSSAYAAQVTYGAVSEFGFDVLRDRLATSEAARIVTTPDVALIDEADSVLVDEALVPLVLAGAADAGQADQDIAHIARSLRPGRDYEVDEDGRSVHLTDQGTRAVEAALGGIDLYTDPHLTTLTRLNVALYAEALLRRDIDYIVRDGRIHLVNASRGRVARLQRWPDGLHAAVEAKEGLAATETGEILDSITIQSLVKRYPTVCGMTGTAVAVGEQLREFYDLEIAVIPPNRPCVRADQPDRLYATQTQKEKALADHAAAVHAEGRPVLIGTLDVAESERIAQRLTRQGLSCVVLNAKNDAEEAAIVAEAGTRGAVTVSTQMAGRGTDIRLGGAAGDDGQIAALGGLHVIGAGRHGSSRLDHQLRGRAGRQGDPGSSVFFASLQDELVTRHVPDARPPAAIGPDGETRTPSRGRRSRTRSASPKASAWKSTATPGATTRSSTSSGQACSRSATGCSAPTRPCAPSPAGPRTAPKPCKPSPKMRYWQTPPARSPSGTWTGPGRITSATWPTSARAFTCARSDAVSTRSTNSTRRPSARSPACSRTSRNGRSRASRPSPSPPTGPIWPPPA